MEGNNPVNIRDIASVRFKNPKFVFDGKRMQPIYERRCWDYTSPLVYERQMRVIPPFVQPGYNLSSQILCTRSPENSTADESVTSKFAHMSINKIRSPVNTLVWNPDGRRLLSGTASGEITMWNGFSFNFDTILQAHEAPIKAMCWSSNAALLISSDSMGMIKYWNTSMSNVQVIEAHTEGIKDLSFSHNDTKFCSASDDSTIKIWDSVTAKHERTLKGHNWDVRKAQWHEHLALIASGGKDNLLKLWDPREEKALTTFHYHKNTILSLRFYKDNYLISGGKDQVIKMLDLRNMEECFTYKNNNKDVTSLAVHPFTNLFASGSNEGSLYFWDFMVNDPIAVSDNKHENTVWALDFHPAGHVLASGAADFMIKFWIRPAPDMYEGEIEHVEDQHPSEEFDHIPGL